MSTSEKYSSLVLDANAIVDDTTASGAGADGGGAKLSDKVRDSSFTVIKYCYDI